MAEKQEIEVTISEDGHVTYHIKGIKGPKCVDVGKSIAKEFIAYIGLYCIKKIHGFCGADGKTTGRGDSPQGEDRREGGRRILRLLRQTAHRAS